MGLKLSKESECQDMIQQLIRMGILDFNGKRVHDMTHGELHQLLAVTKSKQVNIESAENKWF